VHGQRLLGVTAVVTLCAWCGWVSGFHRTTLAAEVTWAVSTVGVIVVDVAVWRHRAGARAGWCLEPAAEPWPRRNRGGAGRAFAGVAPWLVLLVAALAWDALGLDSGPHQYHLTISALAQAYRPLDAALLLVWMLVGIGYEVARVRAPVDGVPPPDAGGEAAGSVHGSSVAAAMAPFARHPAPALLLPQSPAVGIAFWIAIPVAAVLIDMSARFSGGRRADAEEFVRFISTSRVAHVALVAAWGVAGYHLFAR
jgi:hypothetical protein